MGDDDGGDAVTPLLVIIGPTAAGKSDVAIEVSRRVGGEVINADSMQLYRGMDIGTAKVPPPLRRGVPHHLLDILDLQSDASVASFQRDARAAIADIRDRGQVPVLVGGSSLYVRAVVDDLEFPGTDPQVRARWSARLNEIGPEALHAELAQVAPVAASQILPSNGRRVVRALEVTELTGHPFVATMPPYDSVLGPVVQVGIDIPRETLDERIDQRVDRMWDEGLVEEVRALAAHGLAEAPTASRALGYAQVLAFLSGELSDDEARAATARGTRAFARRQERLFRKDPRTTWLRYDDPHLVDEVVALVRTAP